MLFDPPRADLLPPLRKEEEDLVLRDFPLLDLDELFPPEDRAPDFALRELLVFLRPELALLDRLELLEPPERPLGLLRPERLRAAPVLDFFEPAGLLPLEAPFDPDDFERVLRFEDEDGLLREDLPLELGRLLEDLPEPIPVARFAAPAACERARLAVSTFWGLVAALPVSAPMIPPTTAPTGPATLPTTAPAAAPAWVFEIAGTSSFPEEEEEVPLLDDC